MRFIWLFNFDIIQVLFLTNVEKKKKTSSTDFSGLSGLSDYLPGLSGLSDCYAGLYVVSVLSDC